MQIPTLNFQDLNLESFDEIIDVRSPAEFKDDHIPGAINLPVLFDAERESVGYIYKQESRFKARKIGAAYISRNVGEHLANSLATKARDWSPLIYCWRGGQRSSSISLILSEVGWRPTILQKGYKNYRRNAVRFLETFNIKHKVILISGNTGTGKTELLEKLASFGLQTVNLEKLAKHRGSIFGKLKSPQPSQKLFESLLFFNIQKFDPSEPIIMEAESNKIGAISIPAGLWNCMKQAPRIELIASAKERSKYLVKAYCDLTENLDDLRNKLNLLIPLQGQKKINEYLKLVSSKNFSQLALDLIVSHYDPRYENTQQKKRSLILNSIQMNSVDAKHINNTAETVASIIKEKVR